MSSMVENLKKEIEAIKISRDLCHNPIFDWLKEDFKLTEWSPENLVHIALAKLDPKILTSPDGKRVDISLQAICKILADPPPMLARKLDG